MASSSVHAVRIQAQHQSETAPQRPADQALARGGADGGEFRHGQRVRARARPHAHQDIHAKILQRRVEHLLHVRQQAVDLVDEEDLVQANVAEDAGQIELLLQDRAAGSRELHLQFLGDDGGERGLPQPGWAVEQHMIHGFAAHAGGLDGDFEVLLQLALPGEIGQPARTQTGLELHVLGLAAAGYQLPVGHVLPAYRTNSRARRKSGSKSADAPAAALALRTAASACGRAQPRLSSAESTS